MTKDSTIPDYSEVEKQAPKSEDLAQISTLVEEYLKIDAECEEIEAQLKKKKAHRMKLQDGDIPELMNKVGMKKFALTDGTEVEIKPTIRASITEATKPKVFKWLRENGHGAMIKTILQISVAPGQEKEVQKLLGLKVMDSFPDRKLGGDIHAQTLKAFIKKEKEKDKSFPMSLFNAVEIDQAKIKSPKKK